MSTTLSITEAQRDQYREEGYFISNCFREQPRLREFLFSDLMADVCRETLGETAHRSTAPGVPGAVFVRADPATRRWLAVGNAEPVLVDGSRP